MKSDFTWTENILVSYFILILMKHRNQIDEVLKSNGTKICKETKPEVFPRNFEYGKQFEVY